MLNSNVSNSQFGKRPVAREMTSFVSQVSAQEGSAAVVLLQQALIGALHQALIGAPINRHPINRMSPPGTSPRPVKTHYFNICGVPFGVLGRLRHA